MSSFQPERRNLIEYMDYLEEILEKPQLRSELESPFRLDLNKLRNRKVHPQVTVYQNKKKIPDPLKKYNKNTAIINMHKWSRMEKNTMRREMEAIMKKKMEFLGVEMQYLKL